MCNKGKASSIVLVLLMLISLALAGGSFYLLQKEKIRSQDLQDKLDEANTNVKILDTKLENSKKAVSQLETQLQESNSKIDVLNTDLAKEKKLSQDAVAELQQLKTNLEEQKKTKADLEQKLTQSQQELEKLQIQLKNLEENKRQLESRLREAPEVKSENVELGTIVVGQQGSAATTETTVKTPAASSALEGRILVINKDYNFAVINLGSKDGVDINDIFSVYHKNKYMGDIKIEKIHDSMSAANFLSSDIKDKISEGDKVIIKNK